MLPVRTEDAAFPNHIRSLLLWLVGLGMVAALIAAMFSGERSPETVMNIFATRFLGIFIEAAPFLLLGAVVSGLLEVCITREDIVQWLPKNPVLATIAGAFMGFAFPVCECGVVPVTRRLFTKGLPMSVGVAFLLAAPVMNPIVLVSTYIAFGWGPMLILRFVVTAVVAIGVGVVFALSARPQEILRPVSMAPAMGGSPKLDMKRGTDQLEIEAANPSLKDQLYRALKIANNEFFEMGRFLVIGCLLAALLQTAVSQETLLALGEGPLFSVLLMQALGFILSVCSTVDAFLALAFTGTFTGGSILAFLTFGPMVDIKSTLMFVGVFKKKTVAYLILLPLLMTLLIGLWVNLFVVI
jgi:uncharacterized protein